jgi:hypothetical protein
MHKKKRIISVLALLIISAGLWSCQWHTIEPSVFVPDPNTPISFSAEIQPIFDSKCVSCHVSQSPDLSVGSSYNSLIQGDYINTASPETSLLYTKMKDNQHPSISGTFSASELAILLVWIEQGANNN